MKPQQGRSTTTGAEAYAWQVLLALLLVVLWLPAAQADVTPEDEYKDLIRVSQSVSPLGEHRRKGRA